MGLGIFDVVIKRLNNAKTQLKGNNNKNTLEIQLLDRLLAEVGEITNELQKFKDGLYTEESFGELKQKVQDFSNSVNDELQGISQAGKPINKKIYATLCAIKGPVDMIASKDYLQKLSDKEAVLKSFYDFSFIDNQFGKVEIKSGKNSENEISTSSKAEIEINTGNNAEIEINTGNNAPAESHYGTDFFSAAIAEYKEGCESYKNNLQSAMTGIAKDDKYPAEVFTEKINFLTELIQDFGGKTRPFDKIRDTYIMLNNFGKDEADKQKDPKGKDAVFDLDDRNILSYRFFNHALGLAADKSFITGQISQAGLPDDIHKQLIGLVDRLLPYQKGRSVTRVTNKKTGATVNEEDPMDRRILGCDDALRDKFNRTAVVIQMLSSSYKMMQQEHLDAPGQPYYAAYQKLKDFNDKIIRSLKNEPHAAAPTGKDLQGVLTEIEKCFKTLPDNAIYREDGPSAKTMALAAVLTDVSNVIPELKNETDAIHKIFGERAVKLRNNLVKKANTTPYNTDNNKLLIDTVLGKSCGLSYDGFLPEKDYYMAFYDQMAADPAYNAHVMTKVKNDLDDWVKAEKDGIEYHPNFAVLRNQNEAFNQSGSSAIEGTRPEKECRVPLYKMYLMAKFIQQEQAGKTMDAGQIAALQKRADALYESGNFAGLDNITATEFSDAVKQNGGVRALVSQSEERRAGEDNVAVAELEANRTVLTSLNSYWSSVDPVTVASLTEASRGISKNSEGYEAISTAVKKINDLKAIGIGPSRKEYQELLKACRDYQRTHQDPSSAAGKRRLGAVNQMIDGLQPLMAPQLAVQAQQPEPQEEQQPEPQEAQQSDQEAVLQNQEAVLQNQEAAPQVPQPVQPVQKLKMFSNLQERFDQLSAEALLGGKENPDNKWYYDVADGLRQVSDAIQNKETFSADQVKAAFQNLYTASKVMLDRGRDGVPEEMQPLFTALLAAQKPLDCHLQNLKNGKTLDEALADPSWLKGLFVDTPKVKDREDYVPGKFNLGEMNQKAIFDAYKKDAAQARLIMEKHIEDLTGDEYDPKGMLEAKLAIMQDFINASTKAPLEGDRKEYFLSKFNDLYRRFDQKQVKDLGSNDFVMSEAFFTTQMDALLSVATLSGSITDIKDLDERTSALLQNEMIKLRLEPPKMGFTNEMIERFEAYSFTVQSLKRHLDSLQYELNDLRTEDHPDLFSLAQDLGTITSSLTSYIRGDEGANLPTNEQYINVAKKLEALMDNCTLFGSKSNESKDDFKQNGITSPLFEILQGIGRSVPELSGRMKPIIQQQEKKYKMEFLMKQEQLKGLSKNQVEQAERYLAGTRKNMFDEDFKIMAACIKMARDPAYNKKLVEELPGVFSNFLQNMETIPGFGQHDLFSNRTQMGEPIAPEQNYKNAYTLYLLGKQFLKEREKMAAADNPKLSGAQRVNNLVNPEIKRLMTSETIDDTFLSSIGSIVHHIQSTDIFESLEDNGPIVMNEIVQSSDNVKILMDALNKQKQGYLEGISDAAHNAMMQVSGRDSESYQKMSDAYKRVFEKNAFPGAADPEDYRKLYDACKEYALSHDSKPFTNNGKLREATAMIVMCKVGRELATKDPEFAKEYQNDHAMNMARSKQYRDAAAQYEKEQITKILSQHSDKYKNGFKALPVDAQNKLKEHYGMLTIAQGFDKALENASGHEITGKFTDPNVQEKLKVCFNDMKANRANNMDSFNAKPEDKLNQIVPKEASAQKGNVL